MPSTRTVLNETVEAWDRIFAVNVRAVFLGVRAVARGLVEAGQDGAIVAVSSVNGALADSGAAAYSASKAAVDHLVRVAAVELGRPGIRVNAVAPGPADTPMLSGARDVSGYRDDVRRATPLGRIGTPDLHRAARARRPGHWPDHPVGLGFGSDDRAGPRPVRGPERAGPVRADPLARRRSVSSGTR